MGEINKTITTTVEVSVNIKLILGDTEPDAPTGYERIPEWDFDLGVLGKLWAYKATP